MTKFKVFVFRQRRHWRRQQRHLGYDNSSLNIHVPASLKCQTCDLFISAVHPEFPQLCLTQYNIFFNVSNVLSLSPSPEKQFN